jgi:hypothetical protein
MAILAVKPVSSSISPLCILLSSYSGHQGDWQTPPDLQEQWKKDRKTKAEKRRLRRQALLEQAADPLSVKKGGKKSRKLIRAAANADPSELIPNRIFNMSTLVEQIRRFAATIEGGSSMALPPMPKYERARVHEIALAFNLKSQSRGKGFNRYTTLWRTSFTGLQIDEKKIARSVANQDKGFGPKGKGASRNPPPKDGDEVGKVCTISPPISWVSRELCLRRLRKSGNLILASACYKPWAGWKAIELETLVDCGSR